MLIIVCELHQQAVIELVLMRQDAALHKIMSGMRLETKVIISRTGVRCILGDRIREYRTKLSALNADHIWRVAGIVQTLDIVLDLLGSVRFLKFWMPTLWALMGCG